MCRFPKPTPRLIGRMAAKRADDAALRQWATKVKERAGWRCEVCGEVGGLEAHHIVKRSRSSKLRYDLGNGVALCAKRCHREADGHVLKFYGRDEQGRIRYERITT